MLKWVWDVNFRILIIICFFKVHLPSKSRNWIRPALFPRNWLGSSFLELDQNWQAYLPKNRPGTKLVESNWTLNMIRWQSTCVRIVEKVTLKSRCFCAMVATILTIHFVWCPPWLKFPKVIDHLIIILIFKIFLKICQFIALFFG